MSQLFFFVFRNGKSRLIFFSFFYLKDQFSKTKPVIFRAILTNLSLFLLLNFFFQIFLILMDRCRLPEILNLLAKSHIIKNDKSLISYEDRFQINIVIDKIALMKLTDSYSDLTEQIFESMFVESFIWDIVLKGFSFVELSQAVCICFWYHAAVENRKIWRHYLLERSFFV